MKTWLILILLFFSGTQLFAGFVIEMGNLSRYVKTGNIFEVVVNCVTAEYDFEYDENNNQQKTIVSYLVEGYVTNSSNGFVNDTIKLRFFCNHLVYSYVMFSGIETQMEIGKKYICLVNGFDFSNTWLLLRAEENEYVKIYNEFVGSKKVVNFIKQHYSLDKGSNNPIKNGDNYFLYVDTLNMDNVLFYNLLSKKFTLLTQDKFYESDTIEFNQYEDIFREFKNRCYFIKTKNASLILNKDDLSVCTLTYPDDEYIPKTSFIKPNAKSKHYKIKRIISSFLDFFQK